MKLVGFFNRDGGTFRTTDMQAYEKRAEEVFRDAGHALFMDEPQRFNTLLLDFVASRCSRQK